MGIWGYVLGYATKRRRRNADSKTPKFKTPIVNRRRDGQHFDGQNATSQNADGQNVGAQNAAVNIPTQFSWLKWNNNAWINLINVLKIVQNPHLHIRDYWR